MATHPEGEIEFDTNGAIPRGTYNYGYGETDLYETPELKLDPENNTGVLHTLGVKIEE